MSKNQLKIIGAGFGRTGTLSIKAALEELGFGPCYHMKVALFRPWHILFWLRAIHKKKVNWKRFFRKYNSVVDWPACEFYKELSEIYPEALILLNVRDAETWYDSSLKTIYRIQKIWPSWYPRVLTRMQNELIFQGRFDGQFENRDKAIKNFKNHIQEVKQKIPEERLLVFDVKEGWEPLCKFLGVPVPENREFPHLNETSEYTKYIYLLWVIRIATPIGILFGLLLLYRMI